MNNLNSLFDSIFAFGSELCISFFIYGFVGSVIALIWSAFFIKRFNRQGKFDRPNKLWAIVATISKYYIPFVCIVLMGFLTGIYGVNSKVNDKIENTVHKAIDAMTYSNISLTGLQKHLNGQRSLEQALVLELGKSNSDIHSNTIIAKSMLREFGYPSQIDELVEKIQTTDFSNLSKGLHFGVSYYATDYVDGVFWIAYRFVFCFFVLGFLKLPILELILFTLYTKFMAVKSERRVSAVNVGTSYT